MGSIFSLLMGVLLALPLIAQNTDPYARESAVGYVRFVVNGDSVALPVTSVGMKRSSMLFLELVAEGGRQSVGKVGLLLPLRGLYGGAKAAVRLQSMFTAARTQLTESFEVESFERFSFSFDQGDGVLVRGTPDSTLSYRLGPSKTRISIDSTAFSLGILEIWGSFEGGFPVIPVGEGARDTLVIQGGAFKATF